MKFSKSQKGVIMTEVLVSVAILTIAVFVLSSIFNNAASSIRVSRNYLIAQNLLIEGMEVVKSVRDSNHMIAPNNPDCWLASNPGALAAMPVPECGGNTVSFGNYVIKESDGGWVIQSAEGQWLDLEGGVSHDNDNYRLYLEEDTNRFVYDPTGSPTGFYRGINFKVVNDSFATFDVRIQWRDGARVRTLEDSFTLYNHLAN